MEFLTVIVIAVFYIWFKSNKNRIEVRELEDRLAYLEDDLFRRIEEIEHLMAYKDDIETLEQKIEYIEDDIKELTPKPYKGMDPLDRFLMEEEENN